MQGIEELAHAKVNLFLRVLRRREDGFHEIETFMAPIALCDSLELESANEFEFHCNEPGLVGDDNLVVRLRFAKKFHTALGWAAAVVTGPQPCEASTASSTPGFRVKS
ncbi:MAG: hypothetical protein DMF16_10390 [Verrucomicrobia bacterium]|nr:MAG: hypothetical protein DMF16_10390 [Verrucomicrobiota bacterium]